MEFEIITTGLRFPEGPVVMADGSVIVVEIEKKCVTRCWGDGKTEIIAHTGGGRLGSTPPHSPRRPRPRVANPGLSRWNPP